jgi:hypothetical protein
MSYQDVTPGRRGRFSMYDFMKIRQNIELATLTNALLAINSKQDRYMHTRFPRIATDGGALKLDISL